MPAVTIVARIRTRISSDRGIGLARIRTSGTSGEP
jgi:hypothetical protein